MKRTVLTTVVVALACVSSPVMAKKDDKGSAKDAAKVAQAVASISAPDGALRPMVVTWPAGVTPTTPSIAADAVLPTNTEVLLRMDSELSSKKARAGDVFTASVAQDVMVGNVIAIPKGTPANGVVTWRTGKGSFGKSAKMSYEFKSLDLSGQRIPLTGQFRQDGSGNTGATVGAVAAAGVIGGLFVTGKSAVIEKGRELKVATAAALPLAAPAVQ